MLPSVLSQLPAFVAMGGGAGGGFYGLKWFIQWVTGRLDKRQEALDGQQNALNAAWAQYRHDLENRLKGAEARIGDLEREVEECRTDKADWMAMAKRLEAILQGLGEGHQDVQRRASAEILKLRRKGAAEDDNGHP